MCCRGNSWGWAGAAAPVPSNKALPWQINWMSCMAKRNWELAEWELGTDWLDWDWRGHRVHLAGLWVLFFIFISFISVAVLK